MQLRKYEIVQKIGRGAYGIVWKAVDKRTRCGLGVLYVRRRCYRACDPHHRCKHSVIGLAMISHCRDDCRETVALKKIFDAFQNATDAQRTFREIMFLQEMNNHENIVRYDRRTAHVQH